MGHPAIGEETDCLSPDALGIDWGMAGLLSENRKACRDGQAFSFFPL
jgi:hypothetical protein